MGLGFPANPLISYLSSEQKFQYNESPVFDHIRLVIYKSIRQLSLH